MENHGKQTITPAMAAGAGAASLGLGAILGGVLHYTSTAKQLAEEGLDPRARLKFVPVAARALGVASLLCAGVGLGGALGWRLLGLTYSPVAEVSSWADAVALAQQQRDLIQQEFRKKMFPEGGGQAEELRHNA